MTKNPLQLPVSKVFEHNYQIPIYQRNYAWNEVEIIQLIEDIDSSSGIAGLTSINRVLNNYENLFGKSRVVVIKSQLGTPICAFEGDDVYWEIPEDLPKMTKLMVDGKPLYIHRANYQIIDTALIE